MKSETKVYKICFFMVATHLGGAERSTLSLIEGLRNTKNFLPYILLPSGKGPLVDEIKKLNVPYNVLPMPKLFFIISRSVPFKSMFFLLFSIPFLFVYFLKLVFYFNLNKFQVLHSGSIKCHLILGFLAPILNAKIVWHHRDILNRGPVKSLLNFLNIFGNINLLANSQATANAFSKRKKSQIIYNGIDPDKFIFHRNDVLRRKFDIDKDKLLIGILGVFAPWKGQLQFVEMANNLLKKNNKLAFVLIGKEIYDTIGDANFTTEIKSLISKYKLQESVFVAGYSNNSAESLNGLDILVHASQKPEPFGRVIIEAQACELPVVASAAGGVLELIDDGETGLLYEPASVDSMTLRVEELIKSPKLRIKIGRAGRMNVVRSFNTKAGLDSLLEFYWSILRSN